MKNADSSDIVFNSTRTHAPVFRGMCTTDCKAIKIHMYLNLSNN